VVIAIIGVTPEPAEISRSLRSGGTSGTKMPPGPIALTRVPSPMWSSIHRVPTLAPAALTVRVIDSGRDGLDEIV
jgi:hypothetical protein